MDKDQISFEWVRPTEDHARLVMEWRNDPHTLKMSNNSQPKQWPSFYREFQSDYFLIPNLPPLFALHQGRRMGFLRFREVPHPQIPNWRCCEISINIAPEYRGKGLGRRILLAVRPLLTGQGYDGIIAEIKRDNVISRKTFERAGYRYLDAFEKGSDERGQPEVMLRYVAPLSVESHEKDPVFIIAEAGSNWRMGSPDRDMAMARALIDVAVDAGASAVKFQTYKAANLYVKNAGASAYLSKAGILDDVYQLIDELAMPHEMIAKLADYCRRQGIQFMSTAFSKEDFEAVDPYVSCHKIASYEISHVRLIELAARSGKPLFLSTGASDEEDIRWAVDTFHINGGRKLTLMQCTAKYPTEMHEMNLRVIPTLTSCFNVPAGLSDHSRHPTRAAIAAVALGATVIEKHFTLHNNLPGPDHMFAVTPPELKKMVKAIRETEQILGSEIKQVTEAEMELYHYARRGVQAIRPIRRGEKLEEGMNIDILRPGKQTLGVHPRYLVDLEGKCATCDITIGNGVQLSDVNDGSPLEKEGKTKEGACLTGI